MKRDTDLTNEYYLHVSEENQITFQTLCMESAFPSVDG